MGPNSLKRSPSSSTTSTVSRTDRTDSRRSSTTPSTAPSVKPSVSGERAALAGGLVNTRRSSESSMGSKAPRADIGKVEGQKSGGTLSRMTKKLVTGTRDATRGAHISLVSSFKAGRLVAKGQGDGLQRSDLKRLVKSELTEKYRPSSLGSGSAGVSVEEFLKAHASEKEAVADSNTLPILFEDESGVARWITTDDINHPAHPDNVEKQRKESLSSLDSMKPRTGTDLSLDPEAIHTGVSPLNAANLNRLLADDFQKGLNVLNRQPQESGIDRAAAWAAKGKNPAKMGDAGHILNDKKIHEAEHPRKSVLERMSKGVSSVLQKSGLSSGLVDATAGGGRPVKQVKLKGDYLGMPVEFKLTREAVRTYSNHIAESEHTFAKYVDHMLKFQQPVPMTIGGRKTDLRDIDFNKLSLFGADEAFKQLL